MPIMTPFPLCILIEGPLTSLNVFYNLLSIFRLLDAALKNEKPTWLPQHVTAISSNCNKKKLIAKRVSEKSDELFLTMFVNACGPLTVNAMVLQVSQKSISSSFKHPALRFRCSLNWVYIVNNRQKHEALLIGVRLYLTLKKQSKLV